MLSSLPLKLLQALLVSHYVFDSNIFIYVLTLKFCNFYPVDILYCVCTNLWIFLFSLKDQHLNDCTWTGNYRFYSVMAHPWFKLKDFNLFPPLLVGSTYGSETINNNECLVRACSSDILVYIHILSWLRASQLCLYFAPLLGSLMEHSYLKNMLVDLSVQDL